MDPILSHESSPHSRPHCHTIHFNTTSTITHCLQLSDQHSVSMVSSLPWVQHSCPSHHSSPDYLTKHYGHQILQSMGFLTIVFFMLLFVSHRTVLKHPEPNSFPHGHRPWFETETWNYRSSACFFDEFPRRIQNEFSNPLKKNPIPRANSQRFLHCTSH